MSDTSKTAAGPDKAPDRAQDRKARIMDRAAELIVQHGFERVTLDQIAAEARVGKQSIYESFESKEDLFRAVVLAQMRWIPIGSPKFDGDVQAALEDYGAVVFDAYLAPRSIGLQRANIVLTRRRPVIAAALHAQRRDAARNLAEYLDEQAAKGRVTKLGAEAFEIANRLGGTITEGSRYFLGHEPPSAREQKQQISLCVSLYLRGCLQLDYKGTERAPVYRPIDSGDASNVQMRLRRDRFEALWSAAVGPFLESGFDGVNIDSLIETSGVSRATIYRQFGNKEGLFRRVIGAEIHAIAESQFEVAVSADLEDSLTGLARAALDAHLEKRSLDLHVLLIENAGIFPDLARSFYDAQIQRLSCGLEAAFSAASAPRPAPPLVRVFHTLATFGLRFISEPGRATQAERDALSRQAARIMTRGIG